MAQNKQPTGGQGTGGYNKTPSPYYPGSPYMYPYPTPPMPSQGMGPYQPQAGGQPFIPGQSGQQVPQMPQGQGGQQVPQMPQGQGGQQVPQMPQGQGAQGVNPPSMLPTEQSYIENILRLNEGKLATVYMTFENNDQWNAKVFKGIVEAAGRDHIILSDPQTGRRYLLLMVYLDYITFDEELNYTYPYNGATPGTSQSSPR